jgi:predicted phage tail protein
VAGFTGGSTWSWKSGAEVGVVMTTVTIDFARRAHGFAHLPGETIAVVAGTSQLATRAQKNCSATA